MAKRSTDARKKTRQKSWNKAQEKKAANILEQEERTKINAEYRAKGERTPRAERQREKFLERIAESAPDVVQ